MARRDDKLVDEIEREALDEKAPLAGALRKCVILGGKSGSEQLRDWATRELQGYGGEDQLPSYREIAAQIQIDGATMHGFVTGQPIAVSALPDFVQTHVCDGLELRQGAGALEALAQRAEATGDAAKLSLPMGDEIARFMSAGIYGQQVHSVYWAIVPAALRGVLDQIRTALTLLVAELRANMSRDETVPSAAAANQAVQLLVTGKRHKINVNTVQAEGAASATLSATEAREAESGFWTRSRRIGALVVGSATIVGAVATVAAVLH